MNVPKSTWWLKSEDRHNLASNKSSLMCRCSRPLHCQASPLVASNEHARSRVTYSTTRMAYQKLRMCHKVKQQLCIRAKFLNPTLGWLKCSNQNRPRHHKGTNHRVERVLFRVPHNPTTVVVLFRITFNKLVNMAEFVSTKLMPAT